MLVKLRNVWEELFGQTGTGSYAAGPFSLEARPFHNIAYHEFLEVQVTRSKELHDIPMTVEIRSRRRE